MILRSPSFLKRQLKLQASVLSDLCVNMPWIIGLHTTFTEVWEIDRFQTAKVTFRVIQGPLPTKIKMVHVTWPRPFHERLSYIHCRLGLAMIKLSIKFEVSNSIHHEDMKDDRKCRNEMVSGS